MRKQHIIYSLLSMLLVISASCSQKAYHQATASQVEVSATGTINPILKRFEFNPATRIELKIPDGNSPFKLGSIQGMITAGLWQNISKIEVYLTAEKEKMEKGKLLSSIVPTGKAFTLPVHGELTPGVHYLWINVLLKETANMDGSFSFEVNKLSDVAKHAYSVIQKQQTTHPVGFALRKPMDEQVKSYRIPGMVNTDKGTLISVYDIRFDGSKDLPANIDVGTNRSTDGGRTWSAMKTVLDMGGPQENSGVGDPAILFDPVTKTIWVAALWSKGNRSIAGSGPGLGPDETGQIVVASSVDDGLTWSKPYSITPQVKDPNWRIFFPGPGNGISMADGKIVFAAQYWDGNKVPHSTLIYSGDHGKSWKAGLGAKSNTTESQLVEVAPGKLMLNMRDNRGKFRSVATTTDMGQTWTEHATSYHTLPDPVCMGSFIKAKVRVRGKLTDVLFFSNPNVSDAPRRNITIKASLDAGETWLPANTLLLDERECDGYSSLSKIDDNTLGILYEGESRLQFLRIPVIQIIK